MSTRVVIHDDPNVMLRDAHKDELCVLAGLPIVRLPIARLEMHDQATALEHGSGAPDAV